MADRILIWYVPTLEGDHTEQGPTHILDRDYTPLAVHVYAKRAPDADDLTFDIKDDGTSIFSSGAPRLLKGQTLEEVAEDWNADAPLMARHSLISLDLTPSGASGITVTLELEAVGDSDEE